MTNLREIGGRQKWSDEGNDKWAELIDQVLEFQPGIKIQKPLADLLDKCEDSWAGLQAGAAELTWWRRKTSFPEQTRKHSSHWSGNSLRWSFSAPASERKEWPA